MSSEPLRRSESEVKLVVWDRDPQRVARRFWSLRRLDPFNLVVQQRLRIVDTYFDTPKRDLSRRGFALRIRRENDDLLVTLKGSPDLSTAVPRRLEIEEPWSQEVLVSLRNQLKLLGLPVQPTSRRLPRDARSGLESLGFGLLLRRETNRLPRAVRHATEPHEVIAHLAVDRVTDHVDSYRIRHYELEVEAADESKAPEVAAIAGSLEMLGKRSLRRLQHSKLAIGLALTELVSHENAEGLVDEGGYLTPEGWKVIVRVLEGRGPMAILGRRGQRNGVSNRE